MVAKKFSCHRNKNIIILKLFDALLKYASFLSLFYLGRNCCAILGFCTLSVMISDLIIPVYFYIAITTYNKEFIHSNIIVKTYIASGELQTKITYKIKL